MTFTPLNYVLSLVFGVTIISLPEFHQQPLTTMAAPAVGGECISIDRNYSTYHCSMKPGPHVEEEAECADNHSDCPQWSQRGECKINPKYMLKNCQKSCGTCVGLHIGEMQRSQDATTADLVLQRLYETRAHVKSELSRDISLHDRCLNRNELCTDWAVRGDCEKNPAFMLSNCAAACLSCHRL